jgi:hypothetical protein
MKISDLHIGMQVQHPKYGEGVVSAIHMHTAEIEFAGGPKIIDPEASGIEEVQTTAQIKNLSIPLKKFIEDTVQAVINKLGLESANSTSVELAPKWQNGFLILKPNNQELQSKEIPIEVFFHKIVLMRNNLRVLEQKINLHPKLDDAEKVELQQYITKCYGSMTTFNILFKDKEDQFSSNG